MELFAQDLWRFNVELTILLLAFLLLRYLSQKLIKSHNTYLLWLSLPVAAVTFVLSPLFKFPQPQAAQILEGIAPSITIAATVKASSPWLLIGFLWMSVALFRFVNLIFKHVRLRRSLIVIAEENQHIYSCAYPVVTIQNQAFSPAAYGFLKPQIYFPSGLLKQLSDNQISLILEHEQFHIEHKHLWVNLLWDIAICILWFNPIIYFARNRFRHDQEIHCDAAVLNNKDFASRESYGLALLTTAQTESPHHLLCSWKSFNQLEERIMNISRPRSTGTYIATTCCTALLCLSTLVFAAQNQTSTNEGEGKHSIGISVDPHKFAVPGDYVDPVNVSNCKYRKAAGKPGMGTLIDPAACIITDNGVDRSMSASELISYLNLVRQIDLQHENVPVLLDTNVAGFDETAIIAHLKNKGLSDADAQQEVARLRNELNDLDPSANIEIKGH